jgi:hypothetical protein
MADIRKHSSTSNVIRFTLKNSTTGQGLTGLTSASSGLIISTICDNEATATTYTVAGSNVETITTLGTFAAPSSSKCRFKEVDATNHPGVYEFQFADARFSVASAKRLIVSVSGATSLLGADYEVQLTQFDPYLAPLFKKNAAVDDFQFYMIDSSDHISAKTGLTVTAQRSIDNGSFGACTNSVAELANGVYSIDLSASDMNGSQITLKFTATGADQRMITIYPIG